jgi:hypothetical protein
MARIYEKAGPARSIAGPVFVSATKFKFTSVWLMPMVLWHGMRLVRSWPTLEGAVGLAAAAKFFGRTTYTVTAWETESAFRRWLGSPYHRSLMRNYRSRIEASSAATWTAASFDSSQAWEEARQRLNEPRHARRS